MADKNFIVKNNLEVVGGSIVGPATLTIDPAAVGDNTGTLVIAGNLQVDGTTTTINSSTLTVDDLNITLADGAANSITADGAGITIDGAAASLQWNHANQQFRFDKDVFTPQGFVIGTTATNVGKVYNSSGIMALEAYSTRSISFGNATNGEHIRIDGDGNVGIGETSPDTTLHIKKNQSSAASSIKLENSAGGDNSSFDINWQLASSGTSARIRAIRTNNPGAGDTDLVFSTSDNGTSISDRVTIKHDGNLLVGKTSSSTGVAGARFSANGFANVTRDGGECINFNRLTSDGTIIDLRKDSATVGSIGVVGGDLYIGKASSSSLRFQGAGIRPSTGGSLADATYELGGSSARFTNLHLSGTAYAQYFGSSADTNTLIQFAGSDDIRFRAGGTEQMRIKTTGVGIGTNSPQDTLHVVTDSSTTNDTVDVVRIEATSSGTPSVGFGAVIDFRAERAGASSDSIGRVGFVADTMTSSRIDGAYVVETAIDGTYSERMRISSSGNVGIGETSPANILHVNKTFNGAVQIEVDNQSTGNASYAGLYLNGQGNNFFLKNWGDQVPSKSNVTEFISTASGSSFVFSTASTERMRIMSDGQIRIGSGSAQRPIIQATNWGYNASYRVALLGSASTTYNAQGSGSITLAMNYDPAGNADSSFGGDGREILFRRNTQFVTPNSADNDFYLYNLVLQDGNVGIGTSAPASRLHISNNAAPADNLTLLTLQNGNSTSDISTPDTFIDFEFRDSNANTTPQVRIGAHAGDGTSADNTADEGKGYLTFHTSNATGTAPADPPESMRIRSDGGVGIGHTGYSSTLLSLHNGTGRSTLIYGYSGDANCDISLRDNSSNSNIIYGAVGNNHVFKKDATEHMRIDSSGRVGINRTPSVGNSKLEIGGADDVRLIVVEASGHTGGMGIKGGTGSDKGLKLFSGGQIKIQLSDQTNVAYTADGLFHANARPSRYKCTSGGEMVLGYRDHGSGLYQGSMGLSYDNIDGLGNTAYRDAFVLKETSNGGQEHFRINGNGNVTNTNNSYGQISDERLKTDIVDASSQWEDIKAVRVRKFKFGTAPEGHDFLQIGVISQELEASGMGGLIEESDPDDAQLAFNTELVGERIKTVKYSVLYMKAIKALQEAMTRIETLEARVTELE